MRIGGGDPSLKRKSDRITVFAADARPVCGVVLLLLAAFWPIRAAGKLVQLEKRGEYYLSGFVPLRGRSFRSPRILTLEPNTAVDKDGRLAIQNEDVIYFFDSSFRPVFKNGGAGRRPGKFPKHCLSIVSSEGGLLVATDISGRINIYDFTGRFVRSVVLPDDRIMPISAAVLGTRLVVAGDRGSEPKRTSIFVFNLETGRQEKHFMAVEPTLSELLLAKEARPFYRVYVTPTRRGTILCNRNVDHKIYEYSYSGKVLGIFDQVPSHYVPLSSAPVCPDLNQLATQAPNGSRELDSLIAEWDGQWSMSMKPYLFGNDMFIVKRRTREPYYIDFYSMTTGKHVGYSVTEKPLMYSDSGLIYLCESFSDSLLVVGAYEPVFANEDSTRRVIILDTLHTSMRRILEMNQGEIPQPVDSVPFQNINELIIRDPFVGDVPLRDCLATSKHHIILFINPFDCGYRAAIEEISHFIRGSQQYDAYVVVSHSYQAELEFFSEGLASEVGMPVISNIAPRRLRKLAISRMPLPMLTVARNDGAIFAKTVVISGPSLERFLAVELAKER